MSEKETKTEVPNDMNKTEEPVTASGEKKEEPVPKASVPPNPIRQQQMRAGIASIVCVVFIGFLSFLFLDERYLNLNLVKTSGISIGQYWHKLEYVLCYQTIGISWILFNMFYVISKRANTTAIDPTDTEAETQVLVAKNIMQNSIEQFLMSAFAQIISISFMDRSLLVKLIPMINILFIIGRITFWLGYPKYRTFGFMCSAIPNTLLINWNLIKFIESYFV